MTYKTVTTVYAHTPLQQDYRKHAGYDPERFFQLLFRSLGCKNARTLSLTSNIGANSISKIRNKRYSLSDELILFAHEATGLSIAQVKAIAGIDPFVPAKGKP